MHVSAAATVVTVTAILENEAFGKKEDKVRDELMYKSSKTTK